MNDMWFSCFPSLIQHERKVRDMLSHDIIHQTVILDNYVKGSLPKGLANQMDWCLLGLTLEIIFFLTLFDMGFFEPSVMQGGGHEPPPHHNFVVLASMIMKFSTGVKLDVFYTMVTKN